MTPNRHALPAMRLLLGLAEPQYKVMRWHNRASSDWHRWRAPANKQQCIFLDIARVEILAKERSWHDPRRVQQDVTVLQVTEQALCPEAL